MKAIGAIRRHPIVAALLVAAVIIAIAIVCSGENPDADNGRGLPQKTAKSKSTNGLGGSDDVVARFSFSVK